MTEFILGIAIFGLIVWAVVTYIPMPAVIKQVIIVVAVIYVIMKVIPALGIKLP